MQGRGFPDRRASLSWCRCLLQLLHDRCEAKSTGCHTSHSRKTKLLRSAVDQGPEAAVQAVCPHIAAVAVAVEDIAAAAEDIAAAAAEDIDAAAEDTAAAAAHTEGAVGAAEGGMLKQDQRRQQALEPWVSGQRSRKGRCQGEPTYRWQGSGQQVPDQARRWQEPPLPGGRSMLPQSTSLREKDDMRGFPFRAVLATEDLGLGMLGPGGPL